MPIEDWNILNNAFRIISPALGAWAIYLLRQILGQLKTLNGRVTRLESWTETHETLDNERLQTIRHSIEQLEHTYYGDRMPLPHGK
jgi:hypothetical protein